MKQVLWRLAAAIALVSSAALAGDRMVLGPAQFAFDHDKGAVLCVWAIYVDVQAETRACKLERLPVDDAIDENVEAMDEFIIANSSLHPTRAMLEDFKQRSADEHLRSSKAHGRLCRNESIAQFRSMSPDEIKMSIMKLLAVPREPVMNPCL